MDGIFIYNGIKLCTNVHETTPDKRIIVSLSNGLTIFQDSITGEEHFWKRLKKYIESTDIQITKIRFQTKTDSNILELPGKTDSGENMPYYYFINKQVSIIGTAHNINTFKIGYSTDKENIIGFEVGEHNISPVVVPFNKGGFGLIKNV